jgi:hypothetical protein
MRCQASVVGQIVVIALLVTQASKCVLLILAISAIISALFYSYFCCAHRIFALRCLFCSVVGTQMEGIPELMAYMKSHRRMPRIEYR